MGIRAAAERVSWNNVGMSLLFLKVGGGSTGADPIKEAIGGACALRHRRQFRDEEHRTKNEGRLLAPRVQALF